MLIGLGWAGGQVRMAARGNLGHGVAVLCALRRGSGGGGPVRLKVQKGLRYGWLCMVSEIRWGIC